MSPLNRSLLTLTVLTLLLAFILPSYAKEIKPSNKRSIQNPLFFKKLWKGIKKVGAIALKVGAIAMTVKSLGVGMIAKKLLTKAAGSILKKQVAKAAMKKVGKSLMEKVGKNLGKKLLEKGKKGLFDRIKEGAKRLGKKALQKLKEKAIDTIKEKIQDKIQEKLMGGSQEEQQAEAPGADPEAVVGDYVENGAEYYENGTVALTAAERREETAFEPLPPGASKDTQIPRIAHPTKASIDKAIHKLPFGVDVVMEEALACEKEGGKVGEKCPKRSTFWGIKTLNGYLHFKCCFPSPHTIQSNVFSGSGSSYGQFNDYTERDHANRRAPGDRSYDNGQDAYYRYALRNHMSRYNRQNSYMDSYEDDDEPESEESLFQRLVGDDEQDDRYENSRQNNQYDDGYVPNSRISHAQYVEDFYSGGGNRRPRNRQEEIENYYYGQNFPARSSYYGRRGYGRRQNDGDRRRN